MATVVVVACAVLGGSALLLLASGFVPLTGLQRQVEQNLEERLGSGWRVRAAKAGIVRDEDGPILQILDAEFSHQSGLRLRAPRTRIAYNPWSVLRGQFTPTGIDIEGLNLRLRVDESGALTVDAGEDAVRINQPAATPEDFPVAGRALTALALALSPEGPFPDLETVAVAQSRMTLVAPDGTERVGLENVRARVSGPRERRAISISGVSFSGEKRVRLTRTAAADVPPVYRLDIDALRIDDIEALLGGRRNMQTDGFPLTGHLEMTGDDFARLTGRLAVGAGRFAGAGGRSVSIDSAEAVFSGAGSLRDIAIERWELKAGATQLAGAGRFGHTARSWMVEGTAAGALAGEGRDAAQPVTQAELRLEGEGLERLTLSRLSLRGPTLSADARGSLQRNDGKPSFDATITASNSPFRALLAAWPTMLSPMIREMLEFRVRQGQVERLDLAVKMDEAAAEAGRTARPFPTTACG